MQVNENTTLLELERELAALGCTFRPTRWSVGDWTIVVTSVLTDIDGLGVGATLAEAMDDGLRSYRHKLALRFGAYDEQRRRARAAKEAA